MNIQKSSVTDIDDNKYETVIIGKQEWMAQNLCVEHYRNGDIIPNITDVNEWGDLRTGAWWHYENNSDIGNIYGKLYNWYAINDPRGLAPEGWHIPSVDEWNKLFNYLGDDAECKLKSDKLWEKSKHKTTNESGFSALPGGAYMSNGFYVIGKHACFWSSTECGSGGAWYRVLTHDNARVIPFDYVNKERGVSCRCIKNELNKR